MMNLTIRPETRMDHKNIHEVCSQAFGREAESQLVEKLRELDQFDPRLSLVADFDGKIVGYCLFLPIWVHSDLTEYPGLSLGPIAVLPAYQNQGIGGELIRAGHQVGRSLGYRFVVLLGHPSYYPRFGYKVASLWGLSNPWGILSEAFMATELVKGGLEGVQGLVAYPQAFNEAT
jgi:putative acetyltransferase